MFHTLATALVVSLLVPNTVINTCCAKSWIDYLPVFISDDTTSLSLRRIDKLRSSSVVATNPYVAVQSDKVVTTDKPPGTKFFTAGLFRGYTLPRLILGIQPDGSTSVHKNLPLTGLPNFTRRPTSPHWRKRYRVRGDKTVATNTSIYLLSNNSYVVVPTVPLRSSSHFSTVLAVNITIETPSDLVSLNDSIESSGEPKFEDLRLAPEALFTVGLLDVNSTDAENLTEKSASKDRKELDFITSEAPNTTETTTTRRLDQFKVFQLFQLQ